MAKYLIAHLFMIDVPIVENVIKSTYKAKQNSFDIVFMLQLFPLSCDTC